MSNATLRYKQKNGIIGQMYHLSITELKNENGMEFESISNYMCKETQIFKNNNVVETIYSHVTNDIKKVLIKSIDKISMLEDGGQLYIELSVEILPKTKTKDNNQ
ncbi:MAG: hypothetical protein KJ971_01615 [Firmicutes bacterium]|nr:hypothetical protein [Bacillota bacterium]